jgi:hypothetical protein
VQLLSNFLQIKLGILSFFLLGGVLQEDAIHVSQFLLCNCCPHFPAFLVLLARSTGTSSWSTNEGVLEGRRSIELDWRIGICNWLLSFRGVSY